MIEFKKLPPLMSLIQYKKQVKEDLVKTSKLLESFKDKDNLRKQLASEQGFLCAYCMNRIDINKSKIEHFFSQSNYPENQLDYDNLLLCCSGNKGAPEKNQHCDTRKKDSDIKYNPSNFSVSDYIGYNDYDGSIFSKDPAWDKELNEILNLNFNRLKKDRKAKILAVEQVLNSDKGLRTPSQIQKLIHKCASRNTAGELSPYYGVELFKLKKHSNYKK
ncbi:MAG: TIGR02646 family protein [Spirochaetes bacterium GWB1_36_13]|nr:MAG: TIGR02646 family protein [Spirochaetes bacterium GWB1_36_13]